MAEAAPPKQIPNTMYDKMTFPEYEFREFPMAIPEVDGEPSFDPKHLKDPYDRSNPRRPVPYPVIIVHSEDELAALKRGAATVAVSDADLTETKRVETEDDIREALYVQADQQGVKIDKRWSVERIEKALADAKGDPVV